jgi:predicted enzyme related to lactoylglutathione lyase
MTLMEHAEPSTSSRLVFVAIQARDLEASARFYRLLGVDLQAADNDAPGDAWIGGRHAEYSWTDGAYLHFALFDRPNEPTTLAQIGFSVRDLAAVHDRLASESVPIIHPPRTEPWGMTARYQDPDGNVVGLTESD